MPRGDLTEFNFKRLETQKLNAPIDRAQKEEHRKMGGHFSSYYVYTGSYGH